MSQYDTDFVAWADEQATLLRERRFELLDLDNLIEEVEDLAGKHRDALSSDMKRLLTHLLKLAYTQGTLDPERLWRQSARNARHDIDDLVSQHRSLQGHLPVALAWAYPRACRDAHKQLADFHETHAPFPDACPWSLEQVLDEAFWPER
jgi:hypothetical protein